MPRTWDLDHALDEYELHCETLQNVERHFQHLLRWLVGGVASAAHLFLHEEDNLVRCMLWCNSDGQAAWVEDIPLKPEQTLALMGRVRRSLPARAQAPTMRAGRLRYRREGRQGYVQAASLHECDLRIYTESFPTTLGFELRPRGATKDDGDRRE